VIEGEAGKENAKHFSGEREAGSRAGPMRQDDGSGRTE